MDQKRKIEKKNKIKTLVTEIYETIDRLYINKNHYYDFSNIQHNNTNNSGRNTTLKADLPTGC
jgi:hypothetical protein